MFNMTVTASRSNYMYKLMNLQTITHHLLIPNQTYAS